MNSPNNQQQGSNEQRPEMVNSPRVGDRYKIAIQPATNKPIKEIDIKNMSEDDLKSIQIEDPFLYYSIPEVRSARMLLKDIDETNLLPTEKSSGKLIKSDQPKKVTRSTCISFECHPDKILEDFLFEEDDDSIDLEDDEENQFMLEGADDILAFFLARFAESNGRLYSMFAEQ